MSSLGLYKYISVLKGFVIMLYKAGYYLSSEGGNCGLIHQAMHTSRWIPEREFFSKHKLSMLIQCWAIVGPPSTTLNQHYPSIGSTCRVCWEGNLDVRTSRKKFFISRFCKSRTKGHLDRPLRGKGGKFFITLGLLLMQAFWIYTKCESW